MAKVKLTKTELKVQSDALKRFERFLPLLQLKKQQLQAEIALIDQKIIDSKQVEQKLYHKIASWVALFSDNTETFTSLLEFKEIISESINIAGVTVPVFKGVQTETKKYDLRKTPLWYDDAAQTVTQIWSLRSEQELLQQQRQLIQRELNTTSQRVNLFEKVKIPECRDNIRIIKIAIGDEQTAAVSRGKIAKNRGIKTREGEPA